MKRRYLGLLVLLCHFGAAWADPVAMAPTDLPPADSVERALDRHPRVRAAQARLDAARADGERLRAGDYELGLNLLSQQRRSSVGPDYREWSVGLERKLRLPGKGGLDRAIGDKGVAEAEERVGDARHELARQLLALWYACLQAEAETALWRRQADILREQKRVTELRVSRGDAARMEGLQALAALAMAESEARQADSRKKIAQAELLAYFPELSPAFVVAEPALPEGGEAHWSGLLLAHNHELLAVQRLEERLRLQAERVASDRLPDPLVGLHYSRELGGAENIVGVSLGIELPGSARRAQAGMYRAEAQAAAEELAATRQRLVAEAAGNWQRATVGVETYAQLKAAAEAVEQHATLTRRAYQLGELGLGETLLAQRNAIEGRLAAERARLEANQAVARLLLDAHALWRLERDEAEHH